MRASSPVSNAESTLVVNPPSPLGPRQVRRDRLRQWCEKEPPGSGRKVEKFPDEYVNVIIVDDDDAPSSHFMAIS